MSTWTTCWTDVQAAASGDTEAQARFAEAYAPVLRAYLGARWRGSVLLDTLEDALQEVFLECLKQGGILQRVDPAREGGFRAFLFGAARRVAQRFEGGRGAGRELRLPSLHDEEDGELRLTRIFDRAWAQALLVRAGSLQRERAEARDGEERSRALRRIELLQQRFEHERPVRDLAREWGVEAPWLHEEYRRARAEFRDALLTVVREHEGGSVSDAERQAAELARHLG